jgi:hypothetical protein
MKEINLYNKKIVNKPYPHIYIENYLPELFKNQIIENLPERCHFKKNNGSTFFYELNIIEEKNKILYSLIEIIYNDLFIKGQKIFNPFLKQKLIEIEKLENKKISSFKIEVEKHPYISIAPIGQLIEAHRDSYFYHFNILIYLGNLDGTKTQTTELLYVNENLTDDYIKKNQNIFETLNYGESSNSVLFFHNNSRAYHRVKDIINKERLTVFAGAYLNCEFI